MSGRVLVVGSANVDLVVQVEQLPVEGETVTGGTFSRHGGGKGANQAVAAACHGAKVEFVFPVGADVYGAQIVDELEAEAIDANPIEVAGAPTGVAAVLVDREGRNSIAVASGANESITAALVKARLAGVHDPDVLLLSNELPDTVNLAAARWAKEKGLVVILNPAPARPLATGLAACGPILTPNGREATQMTGLDDPVNAAAALQASTGAAVVVSLGAEGALALVAGEDALRVPAPTVVAIDTTGAGDALNGVLAAGLADGLSLSTALTAAVESASGSVTAVGARGMNTPESAENPRSR